MADVLKIVAVFGLILVLLRLKWNIGYVLLAASLLVVLLYGMPLPGVLETAYSTVVDPLTIKLFFALTLIRCLEMIMREQRIMERMMRAAHALLKQPRAMIISMPMLIGMLPSLGGAYFSAPMVAEATKDLKMPPEEKGFINYWYRHPWEFVLPLYQGIVFAAALMQIELARLITLNMFPAIAMVLTGFVFSMRAAGMKAAVPAPASAAAAAAVGSSSHSEGGADLRIFLPIVLIFAMVVLLKLEIHISLGIMVIILFAFYRYGMGDILRTLRYGFAKDVVVLILGTMLFKFILEGSGAVGNIGRFFTEQGIPILPVLIILPFVTGLLTGIVIGFVGSAFPLLMSITGVGQASEVALAFAAGTLGVMLSPVHLCFVLTREYFKADAWGMYRKVIPSSLIVMATALAVYFIV